MSKERRLGRGLEALLGRTARGEHHAEPTPAPESGGESTERIDSAMPMIQQAVARSAGEAAHVEHTPRLYQAPEVHDTNETPEHAGQPSQDASPEADPDVLMVDVRLIEPNPFQPRRDFDEASLKSLSESIIDHGMLQPLVVRRVDESYQLIAGERRFRAAQKGGMHEVPVRVVEADDQRMTELAIVENLQRKDLNALEKASSFKQYMDSHGSTQAELAGRLKIDRSTIANMVRLLELPDAVKEALTSDRITQGHARSLLPLGEERLQIELCRRIETESLTVRDVERIVKETITNADAEPLSVIGVDGQKRKPTPTDDQLAALEQEFRMGLGMKVKLTQTAKGRGKLVINFKNHDEFERLRAILLATQRPQEQVG